VLRTRLVWKVEKLGLVACHEPSALLSEAASRVSERSWPRPRLDLRMSGELHHPNAVTERNGAGSCSPNQEYRPPASARRWQALVPGRLSDSALSWTSGLSLLGLFEIRSHQHMGQAVDVVCSKQPSAPATGCHPSTPAIGRPGNVG